MSTHEPDVPPVPTPPTESDASAPATELPPVPPREPDAAPAAATTADAPAAPAAPATPATPAAPAAPTYGPAVTAPPIPPVSEPAQQPYGTQQGQQPYATAGATQQPYGGTPYQAAGPVLPKGLSLTSMITGIAGIVLGFFGFGFLVSLAAVIFGHLGQRREPHAKPFWLTGIITGYAGLALNIVVGLAVAAAFLIPLFLFSTTSY